MVFAGVFNTLSVDEAVALLSCFVHNEQSISSKETIRVRGELQAPLRQLQSIAREIAKVSI